MNDDREIRLEPAGEADAALLANLLELYVHDMSEVFPVEAGADGRFGYAKLPLYWSEPERRFPFLIRYGARVVGFALVTRGSPATDDCEDLDVAEFFVLRRYRRLGVGRRAAVLLWRRMPGRWIVRVSEGNRAAVGFWGNLIRGYTGGDFSESERPGTPHPWRVFSFVSPCASGDTRAAAAVAATRAIGTDAERNRAAVRAFVDAVNAQDWEVLDATVAPGFVRHSVAAGTPEVRSRDQLKAFLRREFQTFPDAVETLEDVFAEGDKVAARHRFAGTQTGPLGPHPATGRRMISTYIAIYRLEDGRIAEAWAEWDNLAGLIQLGHHEPSGD